MKQVYFFKRYFGWPEQPSSGLQMSHLSVAKPGDSRSKLFFLSDSAVSARQHVDRPPKRVRLELISKMADIADETWTPHLQPQKTRKG